MPPARKIGILEWSYHVEPIQPFPNNESSEDSVWTLAITKYLSTREHSFF